MGKDLYAFARTGYDIYFLKITCTAIWNVVFGEQQNK